MATSGLVPDTVFEHPVPPCAAPTAPGFPTPGWLLGTMLSLSKGKERSRRSFGTMKCLYFGGFLFFPFFFFSPFSFLPFFFFSPFSFLFFFFLFPWDAQGNKTVKIDPEWQVLGSNWKKGKVFLVVRGQTALLPSSPKGRAGAGAS